MLHEIGHHFMLLDVDTISDGSGGIMERPSIFCAKVILRETPGGGS